MVSTICTKLLHGTLYVIQRQCLCMGICGRFTVLHRILVSSFVSLKEIISSFYRQGQWLLKVTQTFHMYCLLDFGLNDTVINMWRLPKHLTPINVSIDGNTDKACVEQCYEFRV